jgi:hypothetical protein
MMSPHKQKIHERSIKQLIRGHIVFNLCFSLYFQKLKTKLALVITWLSSKTCRHFSIDHLKGWSSERMVSWMRVVKAIITWVWLWPHFVLYLIVPECTRLCTFYLSLVRFVKCQIFIVPQGGRILRTCRILLLNGCNFKATLQINLWWQIPKAMKIYPCVITYNISIGSMSLHSLRQIIAILCSLAELIFLFIIKQMKVIFGAVSRVKCDEYSINWHSNFFNNYGNKASHFHKYLFNYSQSR